MQKMMRQPKPWTKSKSLVVMPRLKSGNKNWWRRWTIGVQEWRYEGCKCTEEAANRFGMAQKLARKRFCLKPFSAWSPNLVPDLYGAKHAQDRLEQVIQMFESMWSSSLVAAHVSGVKQIQRSRSYLSGILAAMIVFAKLVRRLILQNLKQNGLNRRSRWELIGPD